MKAIIPDLPEKLKGIRPNQALLHEVVVAEMANRRQANAHTKTRGEVSGGGKKPWRQKGTGRARVGSTRTPVWKGGGVTFGPREDRSYSVRMPRKKKQSAALHALVQRYNEGGLMVADSLVPEQPKTRLAAQLLREIFPEEGAKVLIIEAGARADEEISRYYRNIPGVTVTRWNNINALRILSHDKLVFTGPAWEEYLREKNGDK